MVISHADKDLSVKFYCDSCISEIGLVNTYEPERFNSESIQIILNPVWNEPTQLIYWPTNFEYQNLILDSSQKILKMAYLACSWYVSLISQAS